MRLSFLSLVSGFWILCVSIGAADVVLPPLFSDHMVLLRDAEVPVWGTAEPGENVEVSIAGRSAKATADASGKWQAVLDLSEAEPGPFEMSVKGRNSLALQDVMIGEVWLGSGQSNMEWAMNKTLDVEAEREGASNPMLRFFKVERNASPQPAENAQGKWIIATPETFGDFSAVAYHFGKSLQKDLKVPVGMIVSSWGGTPSEAWTSLEALSSVPDLKSAAERERHNTAEYAIKRAAFLGTMEKWLGETGRGDRPPGHVQAFAGPEVSKDGWVPVKIPGAVRGEGLPETGAVWLRREVDVPGKVARPFGLYLPIDGF